MKRNRIIGIVLAATNGILLFICAVLYLGKDRQGPEITFEAAETVYREGIAAEELLKGVSARDKKDGEISGRIVIEKISENREESTAVVFYAVSDKAGNVTRASRVFEAVFADQDEGNVEGRFLDAGIEAELKEGNIINKGNIKNNGIEDKETESGIGDREEDNEESSFEDAAREDIYNNTEEREQGSDAAHTPAPSPAPTEQPSPSATPAIREEGEQAGTELERESEDSREPGNMPGAMPGAETEPEAVPDQERGNTANAQAPVLSLKVSEIEVKAGQGPAWVDLIETLSDDKDGYETLFRNLNVSRYDRNKPGAYQVSVSTQDTDGNQSEAVPLTIIVK